MSDRQAAVDNGVAPVDSLAPSLIPCGRRSSCDLDSPADVRTLVEDPDKAALPSPIQHPGVESVPERSASRAGDLGEGDVKVPVSGGRDAKDMIVFKVPIPIFCIASISIYCLLISYFSSLVTRSPFVDTRIPKCETNDPENPLDWPMWRKWTVSGIVNLQASQRNLTVPPSHNTTRFFQPKV